MTRVSTKEAMQVGGAKVGPTHIHFNNMGWPRAGQKLVDLDWRLRYAPDISSSDRLMAASIISAYRALVYKTQKERNEICAELRKVEAFL